MVGVCIVVGGILTLSATSTSPPDAPKQESINDPDLAVETDAERVEEEPTDVELRSEISLCDHSDSEAQDDSSRFNFFA